MSDDDHLSDRHGEADLDDTMTPDEHDPDESETREPRPDTRQTAPQSPYTSRQVGIGAVIALVGMLVVFVVPILLTL
jgi:hypothetical protein